MTSFSSRSNRGSYGRRLTVENLEKREVLAGNVMAAVTMSGDLNITGDSSSNGVKVTQVGLHAFRVIGLDAGGPTTINGSATPATLTGVTGAININTLAGNDRVVVQKAAISGSLNINTDGGNDHVNLVDVAVQNNLSILEGGGDDTLSIQNVAVGNVPSPSGPPTATAAQSLPGNAVQIDMGEGNDTVDILRLTAAGGAGINTGTGNDTLTLRQSAFSNLTIDGVSGKDDFSLDTVAVRNHLEVIMGDNQDTLSIVNSIAASETLHGGSGTSDSLHLHHNAFASPAVITGFESIT